jgi:phage FluMu protein Com
MQTTNFKIYTCIKKFLGYTGQVSSSLFKVVSTGFARAMEYGKGSFCVVLGCTYVFRMRHKVWGKLLKVGRTYVNWRDVKCPRCKILLFLLAECVVRSYLVTYEPLHMRNVVECWICASRFNRILIWVSSENGFRTTLKACQKILTWIIWPCH